jgi:hypothetical protein
MSDNCVEVVVTESIFMHATINKKALLSTNTHQNYRIKVDKIQKMWFKNI